MHGFYDIHLKNAGGLKDDDFLKLRKDGYLSSVLDQLDTEQHIEGSNLLHDNLAAHYFRMVMGGDDVTFPFNQNDGSGSACFWALQLSSTSDEVGYTDLDWTVNSGAYPQNQELQDSVSTSGIKRFTDDDVESALVEVDYENLGREEIRFRQRFLWLPSQGNSSNIKSLTIIFNSDGTQGLGTAYFADRAPMGRIRIKDTAGNQTTINKTSSQVLFVEYRVFLVSV